ncbi:MAG: hypothetical protein GOMPHAMPRED_001680 [Gomphillus americanus]|uniref:Uncharacterized protein n=1 Tax=Gomphillus americanus TaxID=1940652 RepID=A0A8H3F5U7_9LECA|nr:MAG: hypothetical protein GOMPHAMPRED_001680 [Gomphillus americanus]
MPSKIRQNPSLNMENRTSAAMIDTQHNHLLSKLDNGAMSQAAWTASASEVPLTTICDIQASSDWADRSTFEYHRRFLDPPSWTEYPSHQWTQPQSNNTIPTSLADTAVEPEFLTSTLSSAANERLLLLPVSTAIPVSHYLPPLDSKFSPDTTISSCSSLVSASTTTTSLDLSPPGLLLYPSTVAVPYPYPQTTTTYEDYQALLQPTTLPSTTVQPAVPITTSNSPQNGYFAGVYGIPHGYVWETEPTHEAENLSHRISEEHESLNGSSDIPQDRSVQHNDHTLHNTKRSTKKATGVIRKTVTAEKKAKNQVSLLPKYTKSTPVSRQTSCWRCRRYKKPCNGKGSVCEACVTSGFRIWSSDIGCRRGGMDDFILMLIPSKADATPIVIESPYVKPPSFRQSAQIYPSDTVIPFSAAKGDPWDQFLYKIQSTGIHGPGVLELLQVAIDFQRKLKKPDKVIVSAARAMSVAADMFRLFVATGDSDTFQSSTNLATVFLEARKVLVAAAAQFLKNCLTGRIKQWFPTFMASNMNVFAYIMVGDAIASIPPQYRTKIWPDVRKTLMDLRSVLYPTARDLMNALSKGSQPLNMSCWEMTKSETNPGWIRNAEGMRLVDDCEATFDAMRDLQLWREQFLPFLYGDNWMSTKPLEVDLLLISSVSRLFITPKS